MGEHRVPMLGSSLRRYPDPEFSPDHRTRQLVRELRALAPAYAPSAEFRSELRAQLVAVTPRLVTEIHTAPRPRTPERVKVDGSQFLVPGRLRVAYHRTLSISVGRPVAIITAVVAVFAMLLGSAVYISKNSLPGDALYSFKRANESVQLSLAGSSVAKGKAYLDFAANRATEVQDLLKRSSATADGGGASAAGALSPHTATLVTQTLASADSDVRSASQLLGEQAVEQGSAEPLTALTAWAPGQMTRLQAITAELPSGTTQDHAQSSTQLVIAADDRADALSALASCGCLQSAPTDSLGPVPCPGCGTGNPVPSGSSPGASTPNVSGNVPSASTPATGGSASGNNPSGLGTVDPAPSSSGNAAVDPSSTAGSHQPVIPLPSLPTLLPSQLPSLPIPLPVLGSPSGTTGCLINALGLCVHF